MSNNFAKVQLILVPEEKTTWESGESIQGVVVVYPQINLGIYHLKLSLLFEIRGRMASQKRVLHTETLEENVVLEKGGEYIYEFDFILTQAGSYRGKNANFYYNLETSIDFDSETDQIVRKESFKKLSVAKGIYPEKGTKQKRELLIKSNEICFQIPTVKTALSPLTLKNSGQGLIVASSLLVMLSIGGSLVMNIPALFFLVTPIIVGLWVFRTIFLKKKLGKVELNLQQINDQEFEAHYVFSQKHNAKKMVGYFEIIEHVEDRRGTSNSNYNYRLHVSEKQPFTSVKQDNENEVRFTHLYPTKDFPPSLDYGHFEIIWDLVLEVHFAMGLSVKLKHPMLVSYQDTRFSNEKNPDSV